ncbi:aldo/keto reductase [Proteiniclasticum sp. BAD-10]|uniref:Aldo/keto reductase n=1 Tax=Proteiniclasticum sediminis TaxID=2804028 RepID=A0A941CPT3_9CLOT|nr:aldo/keto reductase [Proteiniclasticum sediminis]MBR0576502.1 aldo/keto reductase [Proteiniclasticum sediminis]
MESIRFSDTLTMDRIVHGHWRLLDWKFSPEELLNFIEGVADLGIRTIDTADIYGGFSCEEAFGEALKRKKGLREQLTIITKCGIVFPCAQRPQYTSHHYDQTKAHIVESAEQSLRNFGTDYLDLLLIHRPSPFMDPEEVAEAFLELHQAGKVRNFGVSNFKPSQVALLSSALKMPLVTNQVEISPLQLSVFEDGTMDDAMIRKMPVMAWSPLAGGDIFSHTSERVDQVRKTLLAVGERFNENRIDTLVYAFLLSHPGKILPIVGSGRLDRIKNALDALPLRFTAEEWLAVYKASMGKNLP